VQEGSTSWRNTLATALLHDENRTIHFELIDLAQDSRKTTVASATVSSQNQKKILFAFQKYKDFTMS